MLGKKAIGRESEKERERKRAREREKGGGREREGERENSELYERERERTQNFMNKDRYFRQLPFLTISLVNPVHIRHQQQY